MNPHTCGHLIFDKRAKTKKKNKKQKTKKKTKKKNQKTKNKKTKFLTYGASSTGG